MNGMLLLCLGAMKSWTWLGHSVEVFLIAYTAYIISTVWTLFAAAWMNSENKVAFYTATFIVISLYPLADCAGAFIDGLANLLNIMAPGSRFHGNNFNNHTNLA